MPRTLLQIVALSLIFSYVHAAEPALNTLNPAEMAILAMAAGKHVYLEKPCSHNPHEGELLIAAARKTGRFVQMGNQRRSFSIATPLPGRSFMTLPR